MEINAQTVIDKLANNFATQSAKDQRDKVVLESQLEALQERLGQLESENENLSRELQNTRSAPVDGEVVG